MTDATPPGMDCPRCGARVAPEAAECPRCGVVFAKLEERAFVPLPSLSGAAKRAAPPRDAAADVLAPFVRAGRIAVLIALAWWTWSFARVPLGPGVMGSVLHLPNLVFHEAGHIIFGLFGHFISALMGSGFQILFPLVFAVAFLRQRNPFAAAACTWWSGQNVLDVAPYIADARVLRLTLIGGRTGGEVEGHDWEFILTTLGMTHLDRTIGLTAHWLGLAIMIGSIVWAASVIGRGAHGVRGGDDGARRNPG